MFIRLKKLVYNLPNSPEKFHEDENNIVIEEIHTKCDKWDFPTQKLNVMGLNLDNLYSSMTSSSASESHGLSCEVNRNLFFEPVSLESV